MYELHYTFYWDLLSYIPSYDDPTLSMRDESFDFNARFVTNAQARLLKDGRFYITVPPGLANSDFQINVTQNGVAVPQTMYLTVHN